MPPARSSSSYTTRIASFGPKAGDASMSGTSRARKSSNCV
jgi:hypothetical protein